jgi:hypothetical protein
MPTKDEYTEKLKTQLNEWNIEIDKLQARAKEAYVDASVSIENNIETLREKRDEAQEKLEELYKTSGISWEHLKKGAENAWRELRDALEKAKSEFD